MTLYFIWNTLLIIACLIYITVRSLFMGEGGGVREGLRQVLGTRGISFTISEKFHIHSSVSFQEVTPQTPPTNSQLILGYHMYRYCIFLNTIIICHIGQKNKRSGIVNCDAAQPFLS